MTVALWCILAAIFVPYLCTILAKTRADFDNARPREWLAAQTGWRQRAHWAQNNGFEALPPFAAAVLVAHVAGAPQGQADLLALLFIAARLVYVACYLADRAALRSLAWMVGMGCVVGLFVVAA